MASGAASGTSAAGAAAVLVLAALVAACGQASETPMEQAVAASVPAPDLAAAPQAATGARIDSTAVEALSFDLPLYPGAVVEGDAASRIALPAGTTLMLTLRSMDPPGQVAAFYRDALKARAAGAEYADMGDPAGAGGATLVLADPGAGLALQVQVSPETAGSVVQIVDTRASR